ncbi:hypothetical protein [Aquibium oceanicum]|uniref:Uncharacterized protein n=1 Tax=Aquibium oceanicum TaxID=1670800 RepID=A0A1L3SXK8_9HYPH|nr:hypothetical protein [Aquibium oceanicum]APH74084.1 hypothetical protein BSQ44_23985 [Aquibium oceanicum]
MEVHDRGIGALRSNVPFSRVLFLVAAIWVIGATFHFGSTQYGFAFLEKYAPDWSLFGWARITASAVAAGCLFLAFRGPRLVSPAMHVGNRKEAVLLAFASNFSGAVLLLAAATVVLAPQILNELVREGQLLSIATELVLLIALAGFARCVWISREVRDFRPLGLPPSVAFSAMLACTFLILMEEMSWGQHWLGWEAGELFAGNAQNETNFHNFATYMFEAAYYSAAFMAFIALPAFWQSSGNQILRTLAPFVPPPAFAVASLPVAGLLFEEWNILLYQLWFFLAILIAVRWVLETVDKGGPIYRRSVGMVSLLMGSQIIFLILGDGMVDGYELSEIREFLIASLIACYASLIYLRLRYALAAHSTSHSSV